MLKSLTFRKSDGTARIAVRQGFRQPRSFYFWIFSRIKSISADFSAESPVPSGNLYSNNSKHEQKSQADLKKDNVISKKGEKS